MARLHSDENFDHRVVTELRKLGHDVLTAKEAGRAGQGIPDADVLAFAISQARAVLTFDRRDYTRLHRHVHAHCGIIVCSDDKDVSALAARINRAVMAHASLDNVLLRVNRPPTP